MKTLEQLKANLETVERLFRAPQRRLCDDQDLTLELMKIQMRIRQLISTHEIEGIPEQLRIYPGSTMPIQEAIDDLHQKLDSFVEIMDRSNEDLKRLGDE